MQLLTIGSLTLMNNDTATGYVVQVPLEGLDAPDYRENSYDKPGADGQTLSSLLYGPRVLTFPGEMVASTPAAYEALRLALGTACTIRRDADNQPQPTVITWTTRGGSSYFVNAYPRKPNMPYEYATTSKFLLTFVVPDGVIYGLTPIASGQITPPTGGGFSLPVTVPISATPQAGGSVTVTNTGQLDTSPTVTLYGPLTNPYVQNAATGDYFQLDYTINGGDYVAIDMADHTVLLNGSTSLIGYRVSGSSWWALKPGSNAIGLTTSSTADTGYATVTGYPAYLSV